MNSIINTYYNNIGIKMEEGFQDFKVWYLSKPLVARTYVTIAFILAAAFGLGLLAYPYIPYTFQLTLVILFIEIHKM